MEVLGTDDTPIRSSVPRAMVRCECAEVPFEEVARHLEQHGLQLEDIFQKTGCGQMCTACVPDLRSFLAQRRTAA